MRTYIALVLAIVVAALASYSAVQGALEVSRYKRTVSALETQLRASQEATVQAMRSAVAVQGASQTNRVRTQGALDEIPDWSNAPVPDAVRDSLCDTVRCSAGN
jgi:hypothetical protein